MLLERLFGNTKKEINISERYNQELHVNYAMLLLREVDLLSRRCSEVNVFADGIKNDIISSNGQLELVIKVIDSDNMVDMLAFIDSVTPYSLASINKVITDAKMAFYITKLM